MVLNRVCLFLIGVGLSAALPVLPPAAGKLIAIASTSVATVTTFAILDAPFRSYGCGEGAIAVTRRGGARLFACMHVMWRATSTLGNGLFPPFLLCVVLGWRRCGAGPLRVCGLPGEARHGGFPRSVGSATGVVGHGGGRVVGRCAAHGQADNWCRCIQAASEILNHESLISSLIQTSKSAISEVSVEVVPLLLVGMLAFVSVVAYITYRVATQRRLKAKFDAYRPTDLKNEATRHHRSESCPAETTGCAAESTPPHSAYAPNEAFRGHSLSVPFAVGSAAGTAAQFLCFRSAVHGCVWLPLDQWMSSVCCFQRQPLRVKTCLKTCHRRAHRGLLVRACCLLVRRRRTTITTTTLTYIASLPM